VPEDPDWVTIESRTAHLAVKLLHPDLAAVPQYVMFGKLRADMAAKFGPVLAAVLADGSADAIYRRHLGMSYDALRRRADAALYGSKPHLITTRPHPPMAPPDRKE
jgi:hypothetical protein